MRQFAAIIMVILVSFSQVAGAANVSESVDVPADIDLDVTVTGCTNHPGPEITVNGVVISGSLFGEIAARNAGGKHEGTIPMTFGFTIIPDTESYVFAKQPAFGGVTGNPILYFRFVDADGNVIGNEIRLGRCNKL